MNLTDNEIIQEATEATEKNLNAGCYVGDLLRIIKEQQAEIERLQKEGLQINKTFMDFVNKQISKAIKEFAERLIKEYENIDGQYVDRVMLDIINNLVKKKWRISK